MTMVSFHIGATTFVPAPDLQLAYSEAAVMAKRCCHDNIESADLLMALYYADGPEASKLLRMAIPQEKFDAAMLQHWSNSMSDCEPYGGFGASGRAVLATAAELAIHNRGIVQRDPNAALMTADDLAVALLNDEQIQKALHAAGAGAFHLRHLEQALRLNERQPVDLSDEMAAGAAASKGRMH